MTSETPSATLSVQRRRRMALNTAAGGGANVLKIGIQLVLLPVMAHLLGPAEFGLYALALPTVGFLTILADAGLGMSLAREDENATAVWSTAFWLMLVIGVALALIVSIWGFALAALTAQPRISAIMAFLSLSFILLTMSVVPSARLMRSGNTVAGSGADMVSAVAGAVTAVVLATLGAGAWSLAAQYIVVIGTRSLLLNIVAFYRPAFVFDLMLLRPHFSTGGSILGSRLTEFAGRLVENIIYSRAFGAASLGAYTFANQVPRFICEAFNNPVWQALYTHALREDPKELGPLHHKLCRMLGLVLFPASLLLTASANEIVPQMLGAKWIPAAPLLAILMPSYAISVIASQSSAILYANRRNAIAFWSVVILWICRIVSIIAGFWIGQTGAVIGVAIANCIFALIMFLAPFATTGASAWGLFRGLVCPFVASVAGGIAYVFLYQLHLTMPLVWIFLSLGGGFLVYLLLMVVLEGKSLQGDFHALRRLILQRR